MTKPFKLCVTLFALSQATACAVMSKKECISADWQRVGYAVGADGDRAPHDALAKRAKVCGQYGVIPDQQAFIDGHKSGIEYFCDPYNAVQHGVDGRSSVLREHVCPENDYPGFTSNFRAGYKLYTLNQDAYQASSYVSKLENQRSDYYRRIRDLKEQARQSETTDAQRRSYNRQCDSLEYSARQLSYDIRHHEQRVYELRNRARRYKDYLDTEFLDPLFEPASGLE